jgi:hypothetical protein
MSGFYCPKDIFTRKKSLELLVRQKSLDPVNSNCIESNEYDKRRVSDENAEDFRKEDHKSKCEKISKVSVDKF